MRVLTIALLCLGAWALAPARSALPDEAPPTGALPKAWLEQMPWRSIGPANMGGRITALAVYEKDPTLWWAATASGGLLKTANNGITFEHQFDKERTVSIGDVAVAPSDPKIVWVGTGECNPRNSVSWGDGVYKSVDGGTTWKHMGLKGAFQVGVVRIHPKNADVVYVGALGRLWGPNEERGLFKTTDGGKTWTKILYVDDQTGVIDVCMHPQDPDTLLVATWERQRDGYDVNDPAKKWGPGSALYKTTDGGASFRRISEGLPTGQLGRIGLDWYRKDPSIVYMVLESERIGLEPENAPYVGITGTDADAGARLTRIVKDGPAAKAGLQKDDIVLAVDGKTVHSYTDFLREVRQHVAGDTVKVEVSRERKSVEVELTFGSRKKPQPEPEATGTTKADAVEPKEEVPPAPNLAPGGIERPRSPFGAFLGGQRANLHDQQGKEGHEYGGVYKSTDAGETWTRVNSVNPRPMYFSEIRVDPTDANRVWVLGIRLWRSEDGGEKFESNGAPRYVHVDHHAMWIDPTNPRHLILGNDGGVYVSYDRGKSFDHLNHVAIGQFYDVGVGPRRAYHVYGGLQDNGSWGGPSRVRHGSGPTNEDWIRIAGGDGFRCRVDENDPGLIYFESQYGGVGRRHLQTGERAMLRPRPPKGTRYRFNWSTPFLLSHHNSRIYYVGGNKIFRSVDRGNQLRAISPDITVTDRGSCTALAESPRDPDVLYAGTDDGGMWVTRDGGHTWTDLYAPAAAPPAEQEKAEAPPRPDTAGGRDQGGDDDDDPEPAEEGGPSEAAEPKKEAPLPERAQRFLERLLQRDENADGRLQKAELPERMHGVFERADENEDGALDEAELERLVRNMPGRRGRRTEAPAEGRPAPATQPDEAKKPKASAGLPLHAAQPERRWVSWIEPSRHVAERAYLVFDGHRSDDDRPYVYVTEDTGATWRALRGNLPDTAGTTRVLVEDRENADLLYLGTEFGAWVSIDRGASWTSLNTNLPTVAVHAIAQHDTAGEIVAATHGRSLWVLDVAALRQITPETMKAEAHLYAPRVAVQWRPEPSRGRSRTYRGANPPAGAAIYYSLGKKASAVSLKIYGADGKELRTLEAKGEAGLHRVTWDLRGPRPQGARGRWRRFGPRVQPGRYRIELVVGEQVFHQPLVVESDPEHPDPRWMVHEDEAEEMEAARAEKKKKRNLPYDAGRDE